MSPGHAQVPRVTLTSPEVPPGVSHGNRDCATRGACLDGARGPLCHHSSGRAECSISREEGRSPGAFLLSQCLNFFTGNMKFPEEINCHQAPGPSASVPRDPWDEITKLSINAAHEAQPRVRAAGQGGVSAPTSVCFGNVTVLHHPPGLENPGLWAEEPSNAPRVMLEDPNPEVLEVPKPWTSWG